MEPVAPTRSPLRRLLEFWYRCVLGILRKIGFGGREEFRDVLIFKTDRIGDFVLASGLLHLLVDHYGADHTTLMVSQIVETLAIREFPGCTVIPVPPASDNWRGGIISGWMRVRSRNRSRRYQQVINIRHHPTLFEDLLLSSISTKHSLAAARTPLGESFWVRSLRSFHASCTFTYPSKAPDGFCLELEAHRRLADNALCRPVSLGEIIPTLKRFNAESSGSFLLLPHASDAIRGYPEASVVEALAGAKLPASENIVLCGERSRAPELEQMANILRTRLPNPVAVQLPKSLNDFILCVSSARCIFGMDSAGAHIASAFDKPGVFILGGGHFRHFAPWRRSARQHWLHLQLDCFGCDWSCTQPYVRCIHDIPAPTVSEALRQAWAFPN